MLPVGPRFYNSPLYMREDPYWDNVVLAMHMDGDPYWANTVLAMPMDGADNGTVFTDLKGKTVTRVGDAVTKTTNKTFGTASAYFDGVGDYLYVPNSADMYMGAGDFTVEFYIYLSALPTVACPVGKWGNGSVNTRSWGVFFTPQGSIQVPISINGASQINAIVLANDTIVINRWYHIAIVRSGSSLMLFVNGSQMGSSYNIGASSLNDAVNQVLNIGACESGLYGAMTGYVDNLRITQGVARYTTHFELSTSPFPIGTTFVDEKGHTVTANDNAVISTTQSRYNGYSAHFDGTGDYLTVPTSTDFDFGFRAFTIEMWVNWTNLPTNGVFGGLLGRYETSTNNRCFYVGFYNTAGVYTLDFFTNHLGTTAGNIAPLSVTFTPSVGQWYHIAAVADGATRYMFINGVLQGSSAYNGVYSGSVATTVGTLGTAYAPIDGYLDDLRITKDVARYTSNFNPPPRFPSYVLSDPYTSSVVLDLPFNGVANSTTIIDNKGKTVTAVGNAKLSTTQARFGPTSCYFDGASDYLSVVASADFNLAANNFTVEFWLYQPTAPTYTQMVVGIWDGAAQLNWGIFASTNSSIGMGYSTTGTYQPANDIGINNVTVTNTWQHFAFVRNGNILTGYAGGQAFFTKSMTGHTIFYSGISLKVGGNTNNQWLYGYVDGLRITKGVARYTSDFSPYHERVASLVTDPYASNVVLGLHFNRVVNSNNIIDVTGKTITAVGNAQLSTTQSRFGPTACYFDGNGDYLSIATSTDFNFGTGDFTIEAWIHSTYIASNRQAIFAGGTGELTFFLSGNVLWVGTLWVADLLSSGNNTIVANTWQHVAVSRSGTTLRVFVDGILKNSVSNSNNFTYAGAPRVGATSFSTSYDYFYGYIDDVRITKGIARYTANFTPPRAPFPNS